MSNGNTSRLDDGGLPRAALLPPLDQDSHPSRFEPSLATFPLRDAHLSTTRVVAGLAEFMQCLGKLDKSGIGMSKEGTVAMVAAKCLALTVSDLGKSMLRSR